MTSSVFYKLLEHCILKHITPYVHLDDRQHGFRQNYSTTTACFILKETVLDYKKSNSNVHACFIDLKKAFDNVNHDVLMNKLLSNGIPPVYVMIIKRMYANQFVNIRYKNTLSEEWKANKGVRQGGVLSTLLFSIYIDSLIKKVSSLRYGCKLGIQNASIIVYADDIVLLAPSRKALQMIINEALKESNNLKLAFNHSKSKYMVFRSKHSKPVSFGLILINGIPLERVETFKYLGFILNDTLSNVDDICRVRNKFYSNFNSLLRKFHIADTRVKLFLFRQFCLQFYGIEMWIQNHKAANAIKQFEIGYHKAIKKLLGFSYHESNHYSCQEASLLTFQHLINKVKFNSTIRLFINPCAYVAKLKDYLGVSSVLLREIREIFLNIYNIEAIFEQDRDAVMSRILYVQNHEQPMRVGMIG